MRHRKQLGNRLLALLLTAVLALSLLPASALAAEQGSGSINDNISDETLKRMGFVTDTTDINKVLGSGDRPLGDREVSVLTVSELALHDDGFRVFESPAVGGGAGTAGSGKPHQTADYSRTRAVAFNPTGGPHDDYVAELSTRRRKESDCNSTYFYLSVYNVKGAQVATTTLGYIELHLEATQLGAFLALAAGDYDGDGCDELAVYNPATVRGGKAYSPSLGIWRFSGGSLSCVKEKFIGSIYAKEDTLYNQPTTGFPPLPLPYLGYGLDFATAARCTEKEDKGGPRDHVNHFPSVSLATVENTLDVADDLAVAVSVTRSADDRDYAGATVYQEAALQGSKSATGSLDVWVNPAAKWLEGTEKQEIIHVSRLRNRWNDYGAEGSEYSTNWEMMLFPGVTSGDIDGDGQPELVVAGYRLGDPNAANNNWDLDENRFLITSIDYKVENKDGALTRSYTQAGPLQWVTMDPEVYKEQIHMNDAVRANTNGNNDTDDTNMLEPLRLAAFAEHGASADQSTYLVPDSVFVNGYVLGLPTLEEPSGSGVSYGYHQEAAPDDALKNYQGGDDVTRSKVFNVKYAFPLELVDDSGYGFVDSVDKKVIADVAVGNFDGNGAGREQVAFTYLLQRQVQSGQFATVLCTLDVTGAALPRNEKVMDPKTHDAAADARTYFTGAAVSLRALAPGSDKMDANTHYSICAPGWNNRSMLLRPSGQDPEFFFSDPKIIAILEAAPYFSDVNYDSEPGTTLGTSHGTGESTTHGVSVSAYINAGLSVSIQASAGFLANVGMDIFSYENTYGIQGGGGYEHTTEVMTTTSTAFTNKYYHTVILNMTPYIRYYYETYDPVSGKWEPMYLDAPRAPQLTQMSVAAYDRIAGPLGYPTLGDRVLGGTTEGEPASYPSAVPNSTWSAITTSSTAGEFQSLGSSGGDTTLTQTREISWSDGGTWTAGATVDFSVAVAIVAVNLGGSVDYYGSYASVTMEGNEYSGTVPDVGGEEAATHYFEWQFGTWLVDVEDPSNTKISLGEDGMVSLDPNNREQVTAALVLGYRVQNCSAPPTAPTDLMVTGASRDSLTLSWSPTRGNDTVLRYELAAVEEGKDPYIIAQYPARDASGKINSFSHTDDGLLPDRSTATWCALSAGAVRPRSLPAPGARRCPAQRWGWTALRSRGSPGT